MPRRLNSNDLPRLAEFIIESAQDVPSDPRLWDEALEARTRSAINRAYYGTFLYIKSQLLLQRTGWAFPTSGVHGMLRKAFDQALGYSHPVTQHFKTLLRERGSADYDPYVRFSRTEAEDVIDDAWACIEAIQNLSFAQRKKVADTLYDIQTNAT